MPSRAAVLEQDKVVYKEHLKKAPGGVRHKVTRSMRLSRYLVAMVIQ